MRDHLGGLGWSLVETGAVAHFAEPGSGARLEGAERVVLLEEPVGPETLGEDWTAVLCASVPEAERALQVAGILRRADVAHGRVLVARSMGHDLNNALTAIRILGEMVRESVRDPLDRDALGDVLVAAHQIGRMVESGVRLARIDEASLGGTARLRPVLDRILASPALRDRVVLRTMQPTTVRLSGDALEGVLVDCFLLLERLTKEETEITADLQDAVLELRGEARLEQADLSGAMVPFQAPDLRAAGVPVNAAGLAVASRHLRASGGRIEALVERSQVVIRLHLPVVE